MKDLFPLEQMIEQFNESMVDSAAPEEDGRISGSGAGGQMSEILSRFGLMTNPFTDTVNPDFFYRTEQHERAFFRMRVCATDHRAIGLVSGPSGTGKTLLSQMLLKDLNPDEYLPLVILCTPKMTKSALLQEILSELGVKSEGRRVHDLLGLLHQKIIEVYQQGKRVVLLVDEAHFLSSDALHMIRTLSNLETPEEKLITIILLAEQGLVRRLKNASYDSLRGRIGLRAELRPLSAVETEQMLKFRVLVAGGRPDFLAEDSFEQFQTLTGGQPREICKLAYNALLEAHLVNRDKIDADLLKHCVEKGW